ncbi:MAG: 50S ribosomal protein L30 [Gammaproteobacteria bacterium]|nr:50S ribosomal protein L30 [Gammaproteobacteria bacterium]
MENNKMTQEKKLKITLVRSTNSTSKHQKECINGLGLKKMHHEVLLADNSTVRGLVSKVSYMLKVEEV